MQSVRFPNGRGQSLAGDLYLADRRAVVVCAHGFTSERTSNGRFPRIARALNEAGMSCFAFDFAGCGDSDDDSLNAAKMVLDLRAALAFVRGKGFDRIALYGHSLGSLICLRAYDPEVITMVLSGAATGPVIYDWTQFYSADQLRELAETGLLTAKPTSGSRPRVVIEARMLKDFEEVDQPKLLQAVRCPVLIIHGDGEEEERMLLEHSRAGMRYLPAGSRLDVIPGAGHGFCDHHDELVQRARDWFVAYLAA